MSYFYQPKNIHEQWYGINFKKKSDNETDKTFGVCKYSPITISFIKGFSNFSDKTASKKIKKMYIWVSNSWMLQYLCMKWIYSEEKVEGVEKGELLCNHLHVYQ